MNLQQLCLDTVTIARNAGLYIRNEQKLFKQSEIETKGMHDFVTYVDKSSEQYIIEHLSKLLPESTFLAEESASISESSDVMWIIDPLDGTTNFIHGLPLYSVSIALYHANKIVLGVIYEPNTDECFYAWKGGGAWLNNNRITVSKTVSISDSLLATGFPYYDYQHLDAFMEFLKFTVLQTRGLRRLGSAALDMAWVACGRFEGFYEYGLRPWDIAAGACIVKEAGGIVTDFNNTSEFLFGKEVIASNGFIHDQLCNEIQDYFFRGKTMKLK